MRWVTQQRLTGVHGLHENPFAAALDELVEHHGDVCEDEAADVKGEKLCGVAGRELEADVCLGRGFEAWVFDLVGDAVCWVC